MAIREIRKYDDPALYKVCRPVEKFDERLGELLDDMAETMYQANGVGLAAPQVGILRRVVVIDVGDGIIELVNPRILRTAGSETTSEGCLSFPGEYGQMCIRDRIYPVTVSDFLREEPHGQYNDDQSPQPGGSAPAAPAGA